MPPPRFFANTVKFTCIYCFADEKLLDNDDYERRVQKSRGKKRKSGSDQQNASLTCEKLQSRRKKKKKRKAELEKHSDSLSSESIKIPRLTGEEKHIHDFKQCLGLTECDMKDKFCDKDCTSNDNKKSGKQGPEVIVYHAPSKKKRMEDVSKE